MRHSHHSPTFPSLTPISCKSQRWKENSPMHEMSPVLRPAANSLRCSGNRLQVSPLVSRVTGSENSPATALLQARTLKFIYLESNFKPEKVKIIFRHEEWQILCPSQITMTLQIDTFPPWKWLYSTRIAIHI